MFGLFKTYWVVRFVDNLRNPKSDNIKDWYDGYVSFNSVEMRILFRTSFRKHWLDHLCEKIGLCIFTSKANALARTRQRQEEISDVLEHAISRQYLEEREPPNTLLSISKNNRLVCISRKGREFLRPLNYFETSFNEYKLLSGFVLGIISTIVIQLFVFNIL